MRTIYLLLFILLTTCGDDANDDNNEPAVEPTPTPTPAATSTPIPTPTPAPTLTADPPPPPTDTGDDDNGNDNPPEDITYFASTADATKQAKIVIATEEAENNHFMLNINFTALQNIPKSTLGFPWPKLRVYLSGGEWEVAETDYGDNVKSNSYEKKDGKRKNYVIILKALQQDDHLSIKFKIPIALALDLKQDFEVQFYLPQQGGTPLRFVSDDGTSVAVGTFPSDS